MKNVYQQLNESLKSSLVLSEREEELRDLLDNDDPIAGIDPERRVSLDFTLYLPSVGQVGQTMVDSGIEKTEDWEELIRSEKSQIVDNFIEWAERYFEDAKFIGSKYRDDTVNGFVTMKYMKGKAREEHDRYIGPFGQLSYIYGDDFGTLNMIARPLDYNTTGDFDLSSFISKAQLFKNVIDTHWGIFQDIKLSFDNLKFLK